MSLRRGLIAMGALAFCFVTASGYAGITEQYGWNYKPVIYDGMDGHEGSVEGVDIDGEVGYPLFVKGATANCEPTHEWNGSAEVILGALPPGLTLQDNFDITGIPTERGHWIVSIKLSDIQCDGSYYMGFTQQLRFHITGTGKVIE